MATRLMGFNPPKLRQFDSAFDPKRNFGLFSLDDLEVIFGANTTRLTG